MIVPKASPDADICSHHGKSAPDEHTHVHWPVAVIGACFGESAGSRHGDAKGNMANSCCSTNWPDEEIIGKNENVTCLPDTGEEVYEVHEV